MRQGAQGSADTGDPWAAVGAATSAATATAAIIANFFMLCVSSWM